MLEASFWLISLEESSVAVSLVTFKNDSWQLSATGLEVSWDKNDPSTLISAVDKSLSAAAAKAEISESDEPFKTALVIPPFWINSDGKIISDRLKQIENFCKQLQLKPIGFVSDDEAIIESVSIQDNFPSSFILLHLSQTELILSLVYLGKVKERLYRHLEGDFNPQIVENLLSDLKLESTLPPLIILYGKFSDRDAASLQDYSWVGKKNIETFLHFPEIKAYSPLEVLNIYIKIVVKDLNKEVNAKDLAPQNGLVEVSSADLGFNNSPPVELPHQVLPLSTLPLSDTLPITSQPLSDDRKFKLPKINFKLNFHIKLPPVKLLFFLFALLPLIILIPLFFLTATVTIFVTPISFSKKVPTIVDVNLKELRNTPLAIPVDKKTIDVSISSSINTTGRKTVGDKAKGEVIVYNKLDKNQTISKKSILSDPAGHKYELTTDIQVAASNINLDQGVINLGQTRIIISALDIGPEFNIAKDTKLTFKDIPDTMLVAKTKETLTGGSRHDIPAVSLEDKNLLNQKINDEITKTVDQKINNDLNNLAGIIKETVQIKKAKIDFSREIGEEATSLSGSIAGTVTVFVLNSNQKMAIINSVISKEDNFLASQIDQDFFIFSFEINKLETDTAAGFITVKGSALPKIDETLIKQKIVTKTKGKAISIIRTLIPRAYNLNISFPILPIRPENILINLKTESQ